jgi:three-Cys-motif partner protein
MMLVNAMKKHTRLGVEKGFFDNAPRDSSLLKARIVNEYFDFYMKVMARHGRNAGYIDLFAGPGVYGTGHEAIPILVCKQVVADERLRANVKLWFNEGDPANFERLKANVLAIPGIDKLAHAVRLTSHVISDLFGSRLEAIRTPSFVFIDPCGYKGLSLNLIASALKPFGNDCIFFFNYNRVNMKLSYEVMNDSINAFFEARRAEQLRVAVQDLGPSERESVILDAVVQALKEKVGAHTLTFGFRTRENRGTSHHLVFATKSTLALKQMKRIYTKFSSDQMEGAGSMDYDPRDAGPRTLQLFGPTDELCPRLLQVFRGRELTFDELLIEDLQSRFTDSVYRQALLRLEQEGRVTMNPPAERRRMAAGGSQRTLPGSTRIRFRESDVETT